MNRLANALERTMMTTDIGIQVAPQGTDAHCSLPDEELLVSDVVFGAQTPLHMSDEQMEAEFAYIIDCYSKPENVRND
ncbi:MAG TPA: hypothetical protein VJ654_17945 [Noviherbaspirillum sp.]|nr:hypothetical protein [Noviherbaspirillum sp.]